MRHMRNGATLLALLPILAACERIVVTIFSRIGLPPG